MRGISTDKNCATKATCIKAAGYDFIFRYYAENTRRPEKILSLDEARAIAAAGLQIGVVFQNARSDRFNYFNRATGKSDGAYAHHYAQQIHQPENSAIYFGVDCDPSPRQLPGLLAEYLQGILEGFQSVSGNRPVYKIGLYGSGLVCRTLRSMVPFLQYSWLGKPSKWYERNTYRGWTIKQSNGPGRLCGMPGGINGEWELNETSTADFGQFVPES